MPKKLWPVCAGRSRTVRDIRNAGFRRLAVDVMIQAGLGRFFAAKFRAGVLYALYERSGYRPALAAALKTHRAGRAAWEEFAEQAKGAYVPDITFGPEYFQRGQWLDRLPAIDADIADMENLLKQASQSSTTSLKVDRKVIEMAMRKALAKPEHDKNPPLTRLHEPAQSFQRGQPLAIIVRAPEVGGMRLRYRRVNQAETWRMVEMEHTDGEYHAIIAADYTDSPFPLQYYFQIRTGPGRTWLYPGLNPGWRGQPYFVVRQA